MIKFEVDKFRNYIKNKKNKIRTQKNLLEKMIEEEEQLDDMFIDEISKELDKKEKEEEAIMRQKYEIQDAKLDNYNDETKDKRI